MLKCLKKSKIVTLALVSLLCVGLFMPNMAHAEEIQTNTIQQIETGQGETNSNTQNKNNSLFITNESGSNKLGAESQLPEVSLDEAQTKVEGKAQELVVIFQNILIIGCLFTFLIGAGKTLLGVISHRGAIGPGIIAMVISGVVFVCIKYAADILKFFEAWILS